MKKTKTMKTRIIAGVLSAITVFSVGTVAMTSASALSAKSIAKDVSSFAITTTIDKFVTNGIAGSLLKMGTGYLLNWAFDDTDDKEKPKTVDDAIKEIDKLRQNMEDNHREEMKSLKVINGNIDTKDFRKEADSVHDDYTTVLEKFSINASNITTPGEGKINETTYKTYKSILADSTCNISNLDKNFRILRDFVLGKRLSTNRESGYEATTKYLYDKVTEKYKETAHSWKDSLNYLKVVRDNINGELTTIHFDASMDYITLLSLNNMAYKVREYEIDKGIYKVSEGEKPYASFEGFEKNISNTMKSFNEAYKKAIDNNINDSNMIKATVKLSEPADGIQEKGFQSFSEAWAQAASTGKDFTITLRTDIKSEKDKGFNYDKLDQNKYGFTPQGGFHLLKGRKVTVDLGGHTIDNTACPNTSAFGFQSNTSLDIKNGTIKGGENALRADGSTDVSIKMDGINVDDTSWAGIFVGANGIGKANAKNMKLEMNNCTVKNAKQESAVRMIPDDSTLIVNKCTFENNNSRYDGGAIHLETMKDATITDSTFKNNKAVSGFGGAIVAIPQSNDVKNTIKVEGGLFEGNEATKIGPMYNDDPGTVYKGAGGAIAGANLYINNATFKNNSTNDQAGAIFVYNYNESRITDASITNCTFENNKAKNVGGAIRMFHLGDKSFVKNCKFTDNSSRGQNVFVEYGHGLGDKLIKDWGNTSNSKCNNGMYIVNK